MKLTFNPSPNYRNEKTTTGIMTDLALCLLAVLFYAVIYYCAAFGPQYGLRVVLLACDAVIAALATDALFFKFTKKADLKKEMLSSYSCITALILVLISRIDTSYYAMAAATVIAVFFGKLVFGGFGQNIFNPAAFGEAIIMGNFAATYNTDFTTGATPTQVASAAGWMIPNAQFASFAAKFGGLGKMFLGQYASTIGSTCALLIIICGIFLIWQSDIDWQTPVFYVGTVFIEALIIGLMHGAGLGYAVFSVLAGGVLFGGVFMATDPVTTPVSIPGRILWAVGCASLTLIIRDKANFSDGVLFAILLMNMLTPAIDKLFDGNQIKDAKKFERNVLVGSVCCVALTLLVGTTVKPKAETASASAAPSSAPAAPAAAASATEKPAESAASADVKYGDALAMSYNFNANKPECTMDSEENGVIRYSCTAKGFGLVTNAEGDYKRNSVMVVVDTNTKKVTSVSLVEFGDTAGVGDTAVSEAALKQFEGVGLDSEVNLVSGATFTTRSIASMVQAALKAAETGADQIGTADSGAAAPAETAEAETKAEPAETAAADQKTEPSEKPANSTAAADVKYGDALAMSYNFNANKPECTMDSEENGVIRYSCTAKGFGLVTNAEGDYKRNSVMVVVDTNTKKVTSVSLVEFGDTAGVGDAAVSEAALKQFEGVGLDSEVNLVSGATFTTRSIASMVQAALKAAEQEVGNE
ncbi:MAG: RnfABCDGE type electron transport complex subunit D [Solobacterium sp.]|nr:RnfABCDGE type electron transport complex subunit D [Solobacterium sp.]